MSPVRPTSRSQRRHRSRVLRQHPRTGGWPSHTAPEIRRVHPTRRTLRGRHRQRGRWLAAISGIDPNQQRPIGPAPNEFPIEPSVLEHAWAIPSASAPSLPGRGRSQRSARLASPTSRGSTTIKRAPRLSAATAAVACDIRAPLGLYPQKSMHPACSRSGIAEPGRPIGIP